MSALVPFSEALRLDAELVRLGRGTSVARLAIGDLFDSLASSGGHHELGFSSLEAYARERCERTGRWAAESRALARRLRGLPRIREALGTGMIGWSTAELLARHVAADSENEWLEQARNLTVRELRRLLAERAGAMATASLEADGDPDEDEAACTLRVSATREDGWVFECARKTAEAVLGTVSADRLVQALLAEGYSTLLEVVPEGARGELYELERLACDVDDESQARAEWRAELGNWRSEAEERCEGTWSSRVGTEASVETSSCTTTPGAVDEPQGAGAMPETLDREIRLLCAELAARDLALGIVAETAKKAEVWRQLGFASEGQYARERVGISLSCLKAKRILAVRAGRLPELGSALANGRVGYEAAYLLSRVATPKTVEDWIRRAEQRTVKHLREEVEAAELLIRNGQGRDQAPLDEACLEPLRELERCIASGDSLGGAEGNRALQADGQMSVARRLRRTTREMRRLGRVVFRWVVRAETLRLWRALERVFRRVSSRICRVPASFLRVLCENFCRTWLPALRRAPCEYFAVYRRDAFRCTSPVCSRRDVTPHHLQFRAHGGGDDDENVASLCVWCHLHGVHEGRIAAQPPASNVHWKIGRRGTLFVDGRERVPNASNTRTRA